MKLKARAYNPRVRLQILAACFAVFALLLVSRAAWMQLIHRDFYQQQGNARFLRELPIATSRGMIVDRNGEPLAVSTPVESVWANPKELLQAPERMPELAKALGIPRDMLTQRIAQKAKKEFVYLRRHINPDDAQAVVALKIPGVYSTREFRRFYPHGEVMAHVLGFTNVDDLGQEGLELAFNDWLTGKPGSQKIIRDRSGHIVEKVDLIREAQPGKDLTLSIDRRIQYLAYRELKSALINAQARSGSAVVIDIKTGEILAMVNQPSYNPNSRESSSPYLHRNRAVTDVIEPGSVIKSITVAAALENGVDPNIRIDTNPGIMTLDKYSIRDTTNHGVVSLEGLLQMSSNIGAAKLAQNMSNAHLYDVLHRFGYGQSTNSGFPGESAGVLAPPRNWCRRLQAASISPAGRARRGGSAAAPPSPPTAWGEVKVTPVALNPPPRRRRRTQRRRRRRGPPWRRRRRSEQRRCHTPWRTGTPRPRRARRRRARRPDPPCLKTSPRNVGPVHARQTQQRLDIPGGNECPLQSEP